MEKMEALSKLLEIDSLEKYSEDQALDVLLNLIEYSNHLGTDSGTKKAIELSLKIDPALMFPLKRCLYHYFIGIAWGDLRSRQHEQPEAWEWDHPQVEREIIHLRNSLKYFDPKNLDYPTARLCQIHTNLANSFDFCGRFVSAMENWNKAIQSDGNFGMALGAKGNSMIYHGFNTLYDDGHRSIYVGLGYKHLVDATKLPLESNAYNDYSRKVQHLQAHYAWISNFDPDLTKSPGNLSKEEKSYRRWCLENVLFLNPLNDLGAYPIANHDPFALPKMIVRSGKAGSFHSFFNQIKQEYVTARLFLFKGIFDHSRHYADRGVLKYEMLDSSVHSISIEQVKAAFRIAYSIFDKIAYFLNYYLDLGIQESDVSFRKIWIDKKTRKLRASFIRKQNLMFRALYWVSKDLFYEDEHFKLALEPDASALVKMRNYMEHKSFRVYEPTISFDITPELLSDKISFSISSEELCLKTLKLLKTAREAIMYLSLGIRWEERENGTEDTVPSIALGTKND